MKSEYSIQKSSDAALAKAIKDAKQLHDLLLNAQFDPGTKMPKIRALLNDINQRVHEFNAYCNVLITE
jgi:hypothetical protein